jgi:hypothetical protein
MLKLVCTSCGSDLTTPVKMAPFTQYGPYCQDTESPVPEGFIVQWEVEDSVPVYYPDGNTIRRHISPAGAISAHPKDVIRDQIHSFGNDYGCCGSDGHDGNNRACSCGTVIGTEWSDCWTQAEVRFLPESASIVQISD